MKKEFIQLSKIIILGLILSAGLSFAGTQTAPPSPPFSNNPDTPINVSAFPQAKGGLVTTGSLLNINGLLSSNSLAIFGNATILGNGNLNNGTIRVDSLSLAKNLSLAVANYPAPVCTDTDGKLTVIGCTTPSVPTATYNLTLNMVNTGNHYIGVTVNPGGYGYTPDLTPATLSFAANTIVTLTAYSVPGYQTVSWSGCTPGPIWNKCTVNMGTSNRTVTMTLDPLGSTYILQFIKYGTGSGTVSSSPSGIISCSSTCSASYASGTQVTLTATPALGSTFSGWGGAGTGTGTRTVSATIQTMLSVGATFN